MRKADKIKLLYIASVSLLAFIIGCVDTTVQTIPNSLDLRSQVSIVNLIPGGGTATLNMYANKASLTTSSTGGDSIVSAIDYSTPIMNASLGLGGVKGYMDIPAGTKAIIATFSGFPAEKDTFSLTTETDYKMRIYLVGDFTAGGIETQKSAERYIGQRPNTDQGASIFPAGSGWIRLFNGSYKDTVTNFLVKKVPSNPADTLVKIDTSITVAPGFKGGTSYYKFPEGQYDISVVTDNNSVADTLRGPTRTIASKGRYTTVVYVNANGTSLRMILTDD